MIIRTKKKKITNNIEYLLLPVIWGLLILRDYLGVQISVYCFTGIIVLFSIFSSKTSIVRIGLFLIPLTNAVNIGTIFGLLSIVYILKGTYINSFRKSKAALLLLIIMLFEFLHMIVPPFDLRTYISFFCEYLFLILVLCDRDRSWCSYKTIYFFIFTVIVSNALIFGFMLKSESINIEQFITTLTRLGDVDSENLSSVYCLQNNPNNISNQIIVAISCLIVAYINNLSHKKIPFLIGLVLLLSIGALTVSRMFVVALLMVFVLIILSTDRKNKSSLWFVVILLIIAVILAFIYFPNIINSFIIRFEHSSKITSKYNRITIIKSYMEFMLQDPLKILFGIGQQSQNLKANYPVSAHNMILDIFVSWGIIGIVLAILFFVNLIKEFRNKEYGRIQYLPLLSLIVSTQSGRLFKSMNLMIVLLVIVAVMQSRNITEELE